MPEHAPIGRIQRQQISISVRGKEKVSRGCQNANAVHAAATFSLPADFSRLVIEGQKYGTRGEGNGSSALMVGRAVVWPRDQIPEAVPAPGIYVEQARPGIEAGSHPGGCSIFRLMDQRAVRLWHFGWIRNQIALGANSRRPI